MNTHQKLEQGTDEWHALRLGRVTCSELSSLLTPANLELSKQAGPYALNKAAERITGRGEDAVTTWQMERGKQLEPIARDYYERHFATGEVREIGFVENDDYGFKFGYSPDGFVGQNGLLEIKCPSPKVHLDTLLGGVIDGNYLLQMQGGMLATGRTWCDFVSYSEGLAMKPIRIMRDDNVIDKIITAGRQIESLIQKTIALHDSLIAGGAIPTAVIPTITNE